MHFGTISRKSLQHLVALILCVGMILQSVPVAVAAPSLEPKARTVEAPVAAASVALQPGWNLISLPEAPSDTTPAAVLSSLNGNYSEVRTYNGCDSSDPRKVYNPTDLANSDLATIDHKMGVWVLMTMPDTLEISGTQVQNVSIPLCRGWNLIGYPFTASRPVTQALAGIQGKYLRVFTFDVADALDPWAVFDPAAPGYVNDATVMEPGRGYWVLVTEDTTLEMTAQAGAPPVVSFGNLPEGVKITSPLSITGGITATSPVNWKVEYRPVGETFWTTVKTGGGNVPAGGTLAVLDPTMLLNGMYEVRVVATDSWGQTNEQKTTVLVDGEQKIGHLTLRFTDIAVDAMGVPIQVIRVYDSRDKRTGDFGVGWRLEMKQGSLSHNRKPGLGWRIVQGGGFLRLPCQVVQETLSHFTEVRVSDLESYRFKLQLVNPTPVLGGCFATATFDFVDGDYPGATLQIFGNTEVFYASGSEEVVDLENFNPYEPTAVRLTTIDGRKLDFDISSGINRVEDANGNFLQFGGNGIIHSSGNNVAFTRDALNRITRINDLFGNSVSYTYDANGDLSTFVDQVNGVTRYQYSPTFPHHLLTIIGPDGAQVAAWEYHPDGRVARHCDADNQCVRTDYDLGNRAQTHYDPTGRRTDYTYDAQGNVTSLTDGLGYVTRFEYDGLGNLLRQVLPDGGVYSYTYNSQNKPLRVVTPHEANRPDSDYTTTYTYNTRRQATSLTLPTGGQFQRTYDSRGNETLVTDGAGNVIVQYAYNAQGRIIFEKDPFGSETHEYDSQGNDIRGTDEYSRTTSATYDINNRIKTFTNENGVVSNFDYDKFGRPTNIDYGNGLTLTYSYERGPVWTEIRTSRGEVFERNVNPDGTIASYVMPNGAQTIYTYDAAGRVIGERDESGDLTTYEYDAAGRMQKASNSLGNTVTYQRDPVGRVISETNALNYTRVYSYYLDGSVKSYIDPRNNIWRYSNTLTSTTTTDPLNRSTTTIISPYAIPVETIYADGTRASVTYLESSTMVDADDFPTSITDAGGNTRRFAYNDEGNLVASTDLAGITSTFTYSEGLLIAYADPTGQSHRFTHDAEDRLTQITFPDNSLKRFTYDDNTFVPATAIMASGTTISYTYDVDDRPLTRQSSIGDSQSYSYTLDSSLARTNDSTGVTQYQYDVGGSLIQINHPTGESVTYGRDVMGRIVTNTVRLADGTTYVTLYTYDGNSNITRIVDPTNGVTTFTYDAINRRTGRSLPNGVTTTWSYNLRDQVTSVTHRRSDGTILASATYERTGIGEPTKITREDGSYVVLDYDAALRLIKEEHFNSSSALIEAIEYRYDAAGNRLSRKNNVGTFTYNYDANYRLASVTDSGGSVQEQYSYDADGRTSQIVRGGATRNFTFDAFDRLRRVADGSNTTINAYNHNATDVRTQASGQGGTRRFVAGLTVGSELPSPHAIANGSGQLEAGYVYVGDLPLMRFGPSGAVYYLSDADGTVIGLADTSGNSVANFGYDGFGNLRTASGPNANAPANTGGDFRFHSAWLETGSGLYHMRQREYDPQTGRFLSRDSVAPEEYEPESIHPYLYAYNNPYLYRDPSGKFTIVSVSISINIQSTLSTMRTIALHEIKQRAIEVVADFLASAIVRTIAPLLPGKIAGIDISRDRGAQGDAFEAALTEMLCDWAGRPSFLYLQVPVAVSGKPVGDGVNCNGLGNAKLNPKAKNPDFMVSFEAPSKLREPPKWARSSIIGDFKINVHNIKVRDDQYAAIINHAKHYGKKLAAYVSLRGTERQAANRVRNAWSKGVILLIVIMIDP